MKSIVVRVGWLVGWLVLVVPTLASAQAPSAEPPPLVTPPAPPAPVVSTDPAVVAPPAVAPPAAAPPPAAPQSYAASPASGAAWSSEIERSEAPEELRSVSITVSPLHLVLPVVELTLELRAAEQLGVALIGGVGGVTVKTSDGEQSFTATELGASLRYYAIGDFDGGMQLGGELLWLNVFADSSADVSSSAAGVAIGPMIGYKYTSSAGFTFDGQLGVQWIAARAHASSGGDSASAETSEVIPLLNINVGWSF